MCLLYCDSPTEAALVLCHDIVRTSMTLGSSALACSNFQHDHIFFSFTAQCPFLHIMRAGFQPSLRTVLVGALGLLLKSMQPALNLTPFSGKLAFLISLSHLTIGSAWPAETRAADIRSVSTILQSMEIL